jgi:hypothetical protein
MEEDESGYLFQDGKIINFEKITKDNIDYSRETGALRIRTTANEVNVDFIAEIKPTKEQLDKIKKLKTNNRKLFFEIVDKNNKVLKGYGRYNKTIEELEEQVKEFYKD